MTFENLHIVDHPIVQDRLSRMRQKETLHYDFKKYLHEISVLMAYEVTRDLALAPREIETPIQKMQTGFLAKAQPVIIPILRAGLGLSEGVGQVLPEAKTGHIGVYRDEETHRPKEYLIRLPDDIAGCDVIITDPMLATGYSAKYAMDILVDRGVVPSAMKLMILVAAPEGVRVIEEAYPEVAIYTAALDEKLNEDAYIVPGLGDAGDRIFGTE